MCAQPHYHGHRQRLRERFFSGSIGGLPDYELLELILFYTIPRIDVKPLAKHLMKRFGSLAAVLAASPEQLTDFEKVNWQTLVLFRVLRDTAARLTKERLIDRPLIDSQEALITYCRTTMADAGVEQFRLLFLDRKSHLIADEVQQQGTVDHTPVYVREVIKRALDLGACGIILVHNHPSGDPNPSDGDIAMTRHIVDAAERLGITVEDHLIIACSGHISLRSQGLF